MSFAQRRRFQSQKAAEGNRRSSGLELVTAPIETSPYTRGEGPGAASVAKRILDTLSELSTPMEEARQRPMSISAAFSASKRTEIGANVDEEAGEGAVKRVRINESGVRVPGGAFSMVSMCILLMCWLVMNGIVTCR
jgi:hypothetical protein